MNEPHLWNEPPSESGPTTALMNGPHLWNEPPSESRPTTAPMNAPFGSTAAPCPLQMTVESVDQDPYVLAVKAKPDTDCEEDQDIPVFAVKQEEQDAIGDFNYEATGMFSNTSFTENVFPMIVKSQEYSSDTETEDNADERTGTYEGEGLTAWHEHFETDTSKGQRLSNKEKGTPRKVQQLMMYSVKGMYLELQDNRSIKMEDVEKHILIKKTLKSEAKAKHKKTVKRLGSKTGKVQKTIDRQKKIPRRGKSRANENGTKTKATEKQEKREGIKQKKAPLTKSGKRSSKNTVVKNKFSIECNICQKKFANYKQMDKHRNADHESQVPVKSTDNNIIISQTREVNGKYMCLVCERLYAKRSSLSQHFKHDHRDMLRDAGSPDSEHVCQDCGRSYKWRQALQKHIQKDHGNQQSERFSCEQCDKNFKWKSALLVHIRTKHSGEKPNEKCPYCSKEYQWKQSLVVHIKHEHHNQLAGINASEKTGFTCNMCQESFQKLRELENHIGDVHGSEIIKQMEQEVQKNCPSEVEAIKINLQDPTFQPFQCKDCPAKFRWQHTLTLHMNLAHAVNVKQFQCLICNKFFKYRQTLRSHIRSIHLDQRVSPLKTDTLLRTKTGTFICKYCPRVFKFQSTCSEHMQTDHSEGATETTKHNCPICKKKFLYRSTLQRHIANIHDENRQRNCICDICGAGFYEPAALRMHIFTHQTERKFVCQTCGKSFKTKGVLRTHQLTHTDRQQRVRVECQVCSKTFKTVAIKNRHFKAVHLGIKHFCCFCGHAFQNTTKMRYHINAVHLKAELYSCELCGKSFPIKSYLTYHRRNEHATSKPFMCDKCGKHFATKQKLYDHCRYHSDKKFICEFCSKEFSQSRKMRQHVMRMHTVRKFSCSECGGCYAFEQDLNYHSCNPSEAKRPFQELCWECSQKFETSLQMQAHLQDVHGVEWQPNQCRACNQIFASPLIRHNHEKSHLREAKGATAKSWKSDFSSAESKKMLEACHLCFFTCSDSDMLSDHLNQRHSVSWIETNCRHCTKTFLHSRLRWSHENQHRHICKLCKQEFSWKMFQRHLTTHGPNDRPCKWCSAILTKWQRKKCRHKCPNRPVNDK